MVIGYWAGDYRLEKLTADFDPYDVWEASEKLFGIPPTFDLSLLQCTKIRNYLDKENCRGS